ncbi:MAG: tetratricopeptide repeat protein [Anaerolineae bacterium]|nr:tetratricopeptide repeat protein [Anaerolineae bacterium]
MDHPKRITGILFAALVLLLAGLLFLGEHAPARSQGPTPAFQAIASISSNAGSANVRSGPSLDAAIIGNLQNDTQVYILDLNPTDGWYRVRIPDGQEGWIFGQLLRILPTPTPEPPTATPTQTATPTPIPATPTPTATLQGKGAQSHLERARTFIGQRAFAPALADLDAALGLDPSLDDARLSRALVYLWMGDEDAALADLENAPDSARLHSLLAILYARRGYPDLALAEAEMALAQADPGLNLDAVDPLVQYGYGEALAAQGDYARAAEVYARAVEGDPTNGEYHLAHGVALAQQFRENEATAALERGALYAPGDPLTHVRIGKALTHMNAPDKAIPYFNQALILDPQSFDAYLGRGDAHYSLGWYADALADYEAARSLDPDSALPSLAMGRIYADPNFEEGTFRDRYLTAIQYFDEAIRLDPQSGEALFWRGMAHEGLGNYDQALDDYFQATQRDPEATLTYFDAIFTEDNSNDDALFYRALSYTNLERYDESIADWTELIRRYPDDFAAYTNRGVAYAWKEMHELAIADYTRAIELGGDSSAIPWNNRGAEYHETEREQEALSDLNRALRINPDYALAYLNRAYVHIALENTDAAFDDLASAIDHDPALADAFFQRAVLFSEQGQYSAAIQDLDSAIALDPQDADFYYERALLFHQMKDDTRACADIRIAGALGNADIPRQPAAWEASCTG